jgi:hypothetical protein
MSLGEIISMYERQELDVQPAFQRFFRWTPFQRSRLIESILLGIPMPPIFVAQRPDGVWDVVDGVQRLSTIFNFAGVLRDEANNLYPPMKLESTQFLPSLLGKVWESEDEPENAFTPAQRLFIKRAKIGVIIVLRESDSNAKYELFQRLNTGGSTLSDQEVRNCILVMKDLSLFEHLRQLSTYEAFNECISLTDRAVEEQYNLELLMRFVIFRDLGESSIRGMSDLGKFLDEQTLEITDTKVTAEEEAFKSTFSILSTIKENAFRKYDPVKDRFTGGFLVSAYEAVALGVGYN